MKHMTFDDIYEMFCSYYHDDGSNEKIMREKLIDAMKKFTQRWISVEEELPSEENELLNVPVICITGFGNYRISEYNGNEWYSDEIVTFWRPI